MKKLKFFTLLAAIGAVAFFTSCSMTLPVNATSNEVGTKVGTSSGKVWFGIFYKDVDASIKSAAKKGRISKISTVDFKVSNKVIFMEYTCIVTGE